ncbi:eIF2A-domain-containing protein [Neoconidiobolus thromboides FSU 785]|nr:eIF2A-domain-containing protein [Neoconidiobolus thromboides FSU 785]
MTLKNKLVYLYILQKIEEKDVLYMEFSIGGNYLSIWKRYKKEDGADNLVIYSTLEGEKVNSFIQKESEGWNLQWTFEESYMARMVNNEVHFYSSKKLGDKAPSFKLHLEGIKNFSLSAGKAPHVAIFVPERKGRPAFVRLYSIPNFTSPVASKTFFKADKVQMVWNPLGTNILVLTQTEVDKTGKSYYGESHLYYLSVAGTFDCRVPLDKEGPIHDFNWSPTSKEFAVSYGFMPSKTSIFDQRVNKVHTFTETSRNFTRFSPHGKYFLLAGFGNLNGNLDIYDLKNYKKLASIDGSGSSYCEWLPDGRHFVTATCSPRLRVDNGFKIWHYSGALVYELPISVLYQVSIRNLDADLFPMKPNSQSPPPKSLKVKTKVQSKTAYVPPHLRNQAKAEPKKEKAKPKQDSDALTKKAATLTKKLKQIEELISSAMNGQTLTPDQVKKVKTKVDIQVELQDIQLKLKNIRI